MRNISLIGAVPIIYTFRVVHALPLSNHQHDHQGSEKDE
jgi:hypothetical protein